MNSLTVLRLHLVGSRRLTRVHVFLSSLIFGVSALLGHLRVACTWCRVQHLWNAEMEAKSMTPNCYGQSDAKDSEREVLQGPFKIQSTIRGQSQT